MNSHCSQVTHAAIINIEDHRESVCGHSGGCRALNPNVNVSFCPVDSCYISILYLIMIIAYFNSVILEN